MKQLIPAMSLLLCILFSSCGTKIYHLKCDSSVPARYAQEIETHTCVEGDNVIYSEGTSFLMVNIHNGKVNGYKVNTNGTVEAMLPQQGSGSNTLNPCDEALVLCASSCGPAPIDHPDPAHEACMKDCNTKHDACNVQAIGNYLNNIELKPGGLLTATKN